MSDRRLQVFHAVARLLSFTKAAEVLHMTQPAVTFQIRQLEEQFDTRLFDRAHNRVSLTEAGHVAFEYAEIIFEKYSEMENAIREITGSISGSLTLGASTTISEYMLPALLGDFNAKNPEVLLRLRVSNTEGIVSMVENNVIDLGVVEGPVTNKNLLVEICRKDDLVVVVPPDHELAKQKAISVKKMLEYPFICREEGSGTREVIVDHLRAQGVGKHALKACLELGSPEAIKGAIQAGMGISVLSSVSLAKELKLGTLVTVPLDPPLSREFSFVRQRQKFRVRTMEELLDFARSYCKENK
ncbi:selenium metabolism-associated LysR family transcriptional regulator [Cocleimonas flava]|uniref:DNA-binding transcriptional LysR family regulator n=1 Tax=Cocleimonas flava TaxID=634765 RepID=A0A4R1EVT5_9GAMM|nr:MULTISPECIES: LysR family transcriptional regulator [Cocleimonas]MEB8433828.1 LysR family transcriptional regulator [Cocleimonas sp. KMM 6892]MEC4716639.1 LysR family transcriptional regulator [Cocleimonas sp. KMM 6895]MEC4746206.1 LysR family transcriptional regulator [Cocleimonas sp. KMM 6896]TCJ84850.1 DNA-binding transcriptional LysR family regulator [Cocleimonas flava]